MKQVLFLLWILLPGIVQGQVYTDPAVAGAQAAHNAILNNQLNSTNEKLTLLEKGQLAVTRKLTLVNSLQDKIYTGLSQVSSIVTGLYHVKEINRTATGIASDIHDMMEIAKENPAYLVFAEQQASLFQQKATALALEVSQFVLKGGKDNLMDSGERAKLLNSILNEMIILRSYTYGMYRSMYFAQMKGLFPSLNPFQGYMDVDMRIMDDVIRKRKILTQ